MQQVTRSQIVAEARSWLGTKWLHQASLKGIGTDCVGLAYGIARSLPLYEKVDPLPPYERRTTDNQMILLASRYLVRVHGPLKEGSVVAMRFDATTRHMGILGDYPGGGLSLIHAYAVNRKVVEHRLDATWQSKIVAAFDFPGVLDG